MTTEGWRSGRRGQALAIGITLLGFAVFWFGIVDPVRTWFSDRAAELEQRQQLLVHMRDLAASLPALRTAAAEKRGEGAETAMALPGDTDAVAAADLQERVQKMAADAGATLTAVETLPAAPAAGRWHKVALRISLNASWPGLMELIRSVEQSSTHILIDDIRLRSPVVVARSAVLPISASMVLYGVRPAEKEAGT